MKFLQIMGRVGDSSFTRFKFEAHCADSVNCGDQIWSDGNNVEIADYIDSENLDCLISMVSNKQALKGALRLAGLIND